MQTIDEVKLQHLRALFGESRSVSVVVHSHPDGDALGSGTVLARYLRLLGVEACLVAPDSFPENLSFVIDEDHTVVASSEPAEARSRLAASDLIVCADHNSFSRDGDLAPYLRASKARKILIDHHPDPALQDFDLAFSETDISSTCEYVFWILNSLTDGFKGLPAELFAAPLMTGMTTDTNNFANSVFPSTLEMASSLLAMGVDRDAILSRLYNRYSENRFRALGFFLSELMHITPDGVAYAVLTKSAYERFDLHEGDTDGFVNMPLGIGKVKMSIFLREDDGFFRVSIRSKKGWSANSLSMQFFHGGGHECAAGGKLFFPSDMATADQAADYIENSTAHFMHCQAAAQQD